jgi:hypothetical protein
MLFYLVGDATGYSFPHMVAGLNMCYVARNVENEEEQITELTLKRTVVKSTESLASQPA